MIKVETKGLKGVQDRLSGLAKKARELDGQQQTIALPDLMTDDFVEAHSQHGSLQELFDASPFTIDSIEDFKAIPDADWDVFIADQTDFETWEEMQTEAVKQLLIRQLGF